MNRTVTAASRAVARRRAAASLRARTSADSGSALKAGEADIVVVGSIWQPPGAPSAHRASSLAGRAWPLAAGRRDRTAPRGGSGAGALRLGGVEAGEAAGLVPGHGEA